MKRYLTTENSRFSIVKTRWNFLSALVQGAKIRFSLSEQRLKRKKDSSSLSKTHWIEDLLKGKLELSSSNSRKPLASGVKDLTNSSWETQLKKRISLRCLSNLTERKRGRFSDNLVTQDDQRPPVQKYQVKLFIISTVLHQTVGQKLLNERWWLHNHLRGSR